MVSNFANLSERALIWQRNHSVVHEDPRLSLALKLLNPAMPFDRARQHSRPVGYSIIHRKGTTLSPDTHRISFEDLTWKEWLVRLKLRPEAPQADIPARVIIRAGGSQDRDQPARYFFSSTQA
jgi:hypothetical protein